MPPWVTESGVTVFGPFAADTDYFAADKTFMLNFRVADLDAMIAQLKSADIEVSYESEMEGIRPLRADTRPGGERERALGAGGVRFEHVLWTRQGQTLGVSRSLALAAVSKDGLGPDSDCEPRKGPLEPACDPEEHGLHFPRSAPAKSPTVGFDRSRT